MPSGRFKGKGCDSKGLWSRVSDKGGLGRGLKADLRERDVIPRVYGLGVRH